MITYETDSILYYNPEDLYDSETKEKIRQAKEEARQAGLKEGIKEGTKKTLITTAKNLKDLNIPPEQISKATGLTISEINNL